MAITESEIRQAAMRELVLAPGGFLSTEDLIVKLRASMQPKGEDLEILDGRQDTRFSQKVRNLVSHREASTSLESQGLAVYDDAREGWEITPKGAAQFG